MTGCVQGRKSASWYSQGHFVGLLWVLLVPFGWVLAAVLEMSFGCIKNKGPRGSGVERERETGPRSQKVSLGRLVPQPPPHYLYSHPL